MTTGSFNTDKEVTPRRPFYSVHRIERGIIDACVKPNKYGCSECMFKSHCLIHAKQALKKLRETL